MTAVEISGNENKFLHSFIESVRLLTAVSFTLSGILLSVSVIFARTVASVILTMNSSTSFIVDVAQVTGKVGKSSLGSL